MDVGKPSLGKIRKLKLREAWPNEASDLTPWLAEHPGLLSETLGIGDLEVQETEKRVGDYRADLVLESVDGTVVVENQLDHTDHDHLGKLLTYGAGERARTVVWIARRFRDEHRAALDWLNDISEDTDFFGVELELWQIDGSRPAPRLNVVAMPNDWAREATRKRRGDERSPTKESQLRYWTAFREVLLSAEGPARPQKARPDNYLIIAIGRAGFHLAGGTNSRESWIRAELYFNHGDLKQRPPHRGANAYFDALEQDRAPIERELGFPLEWEGLSTKGACRVAVYKRGCDPTDESAWPAQHEWLADRLTRLHQVLAPRLRALEPLEDDSTGSANRETPSPSQSSEVG
ncbi:MAG: DUF4268 domain-containing protein [Acidobacteria bacterium]|nr:DUF4268 domain-containing protein [Acidobacteriota bacterium]